MQTTVSEQPISRYVHFDINSPCRADNKPTCRYCDFLDIIPGNLRVTSCSHSRPPTRRPNPKYARSWHTAPFPTLDDVKKKHSDVPGMYCTSAIASCVQEIPTLQIFPRLAVHYMSGAFFFRRIRMDTYAPHKTGRSIPSSR